jgi:hypothetical protein
MKRSIINRSEIKRVKTYNYNPGFVVLDEEKRSKRFGNGGCSQLPVVINHAKSNGFPMGGRGSN